MLLCPPLMHLKPFRSVGFGTTGRTPPIVSTQSHGLCTMARLGVQALGLIHTEQVNYYARLLVWQEKKRIGR